MTKVGGISGRWQLAVRQRRRKLTGTVRIDPKIIRATCSTLQKLKMAIKNRRRGMMSKGNIFGMITYGPLCPPCAKVCSDFNDKSWNMPHIALTSHHVIIMSLDNSRKFSMEAISKQWDLGHRWRLVRAQQQSFYSLKVFTILWKAVLGRQFQPLWWPCKAIMFSMYHLLFCLHNTVIPLNHWSNRLKDHFHLGNPYMYVCVCLIFIFTILKIIIFMFYINVSLNTAVSSHYYISRLYASLSDMQLFSMSRHEEW